MSRVRRDHPRCRSAMWICMCGITPDVAIYSKFHWNPFRGLGAPGGRNLPIPITMAIDFYNSSLHYRASRDNKSLVTGNRNNIEIFLNSWRALLLADPFAEIGIALLISVISVKKINGLSFWQYHIQFAQRWLSLSDLHCKLICMGRTWPASD